MQSKQWNKASLEYERAYFMAESVPEKQKALLGEAYVHKAAEEYAQAIATLKRATLFGPTDSLNFSIRYELAFLYFLQQNYPQAENYLLQIQHFTKHKSLIEKSQYLLVLNYNAQRKWHKGKEAFRTYLQENQLDSTALALYDPAQDVKIKDPKKAENLSIFPGLGQMYAGYWGKGLISMGIQGVLFAYAAYSLWEGYYFSGTLTGVSLLFVFNMGGARHAGYLAEQHNKKVSEKINRPIEAFILHHSK